MNFQTKSTWKSALFFSVSVIGSCASHGAVADNNVPNDPCEVAAKPILEQMKAAVEAGNEAAGRAAAIRYVETGIACALAQSNAAIAAERVANAAAAAARAAAVVRLPR